MGRRQDARSGVRQSTPWMDSKFSYSLRVSKRAKHVRFQVTREEGLQVIVPRRLNPARIDEIVRRHSHWIERALARANALGFVASLPEISRPPDSIRLEAVSRYWMVVRRRTDERSVFVQEKDEGTLGICGAIEDPDLDRLALRRWLLRKANDVLIPWLEKVSKETSLAYRRVTVRQQKTRWGSCSPRGAISLNAKLPFLEPELVHYVLVHELCHTRQLNHSRKFWQLVEIYLPNYLDLDRRLRERGKLIPRCVEN
jgi:predicted metal-dependent hydrolase